MNTSQRFAVSIHVLTLLAASSEQPLTSEQISESVNTNPVVIRRVMGYLRANGLVESRSGANGGWKLVCPPDQISLCSVYDAVNHEELLGMHHHPNVDCPIGGHIKPALKHVFGQAEKALHDSLGQFSVADVLEEVRRGL